jgi:hypothetical protein
VPEQSQPNWFTSSYSGAPNNECVECATNLPRKVLVRDSKDPEGARLAFSRDAWRHFNTALQEGTLAPHEAVPE